MIAALATRQPGLIRLCDNALPFGSIAVYAVPLFVAVARKFPSPEQHELARHPRWGLFATGSEGIGL